MPVVKYVGTAHYRILDAADAKRAEPPVEGFKKTTWTRNGTQEVTAPVAEWLLRDLKTEFAEVQDEQPQAATATASASSSDQESGGGDAPASRVSKSGSKAS